MEMLTTITFVSVIVWYIIDRIKPLWENLTFGKYLTTAAAGALSAVLTFFYGLDIMYALGVAEVTSAVGSVVTVLLLMGGSAAVSELIQKLKK